LVNFDFLGLVSVDNQRRRSPAFAAPIFKDDYLIASCPKILLAAISLSEIQSMLVDQDCSIESAR
jgi:hypothetical protein